MVLEVGTDLEVIGEREGFGEEHLQHSNGRVGRNAQERMLQLRYQKKKKLR